MMDITRETIAQEIEWSPDRLSRYFNKVVGRRIDDYINLLRVSEAARMLIHGDETVIYIAMSVGFGSVRNFNRVFSRIYGVAPSEYRLMRN